MGANGPFGHGSGGGGGWSRRRATLAVAAAGLAAAAGPRAARAQDPWPAGTVTIVAPFPPGGQADIAARPVAAALGRILGRSVVVENRAGAGGAIGHAHVAKARPDGHTLLMALPSLVFLPEADRVRGREPAYAVEDFVPVARVLADPQFLVVRTESPWLDAQAFLAAARADPGRITYSSSGQFGTLHIATEMLAQAADVRLLHVPFQGAGPAAVALLAGEVDSIATTPGVFKAHVDAGKLRALANFGAARTAAFPDVPTWGELGVPGVEYYNWAGLFAPAATPAPVVERLRGAMREAMADAEVIRTFTGAGAAPAYQDQPEFAGFIAADTGRLVEVVRKIGAAG